MAEANRIIAQNKKVSLESSIEKTAAILVTVKDTKDSSETSFKSRLADADKAIEALNLVYNLLTENEAGLQATEAKSDGLLAKMFF